MNDVRDIINKTWIDLRTVSELSSLPSTTDTAGATVNSEDMNCEDDIGKLRMGLGAIHGDITKISVLFMSSPTKDNVEELSKKLTESVLYSQLAILHLNAKASHGRTYYNALSIAVKAVITLLVSFYEWLMHMDLNAPTHRLMTGKVWNAIDKAYAVIDMDNAQCVSDKVMYFSTIIDDAHSELCSSVAKSVNSSARNDEHEDRINDDDVELIDCAVEIFPRIEGLLKAVKKILNKASNMKYLLRLVNGDASLTSQDSVVDAAAVLPPLADNLVLSMYGDGETEDAANKLIDAALYLVSTLRGDIDADDMNDDDSDASVKWFIAAEKFLRMQLRALIDVLNSVNCK